MLAMDAAAFDLLLTGGIASTVRWSSSHSCPCTEDEGGASMECPVCLGSGLYWDTPSLPFKCGVIGLSQREIARMQRKMGEGFVGEAQLSIPSVAPCYGKTKSGDRFLVVGAVDSVEWVLTRRAPVRIPVGAKILSCLTLQSGHLVTTTLPSEDEFGRVRVVNPVTVRMTVPRLFEVIEDAGHVRAWQCGLPQKWMLKRVDITLR